ncbi:hypothetical protein J5N97_030144 [Dioscorea zingiberensis]|uniref:Uncharacterized protein n=1 Tax=Dioscorea zingiberensis TaxID=325984 RepID=A0A9D5BWZ1_9LILI|nr:hypothetical protein J5N97_030144 [Dioscorea zingiberensis]
MSIKGFIAHSIKTLGFRVLENSPEKSRDQVLSLIDVVNKFGKDALKSPKSFDERHNLVSNASATVASIDRKIGLSEKISIGTWMVSEKVREVDERLQVSEIRKSTIAAAEQTASSAGSTLMSNQYVSTGASWVSSAFSMAVKAAGDVSIMTKEKKDLNEEHESKREDLAIAGNLAAQKQFRQRSLVP